MLYMCGWLLQFGLREVNMKDQQACPRVPPSFRWIEACSAKIGCRIIQPSQLIACVQSLKHILDCCQIEDTTFCICLPDTPLPFGVLMSGCQALPEMIAIFKHRKARVGLRVVSQICFKNMEHGITWLCTAFFLRAYGIHRRTRRLGRRLVHWTFFQRDHKMDSTMSSNQIDLILPPCEDSTWAENAASHFRGRGHLASFGRTSGAQLRQGGIAAARIPRELSNYCIFYILFSSGAELQSCTMPWATLRATASTVQVSLAFGPGELLLSTESGLVQRRRLEELENGLKLF